MTQPSATQRSWEQTDEYPMPNTRKIEKVTGSAGRVGAASKTTRERTAKQRLTGHGLEPATPHVPSGIVIRAVVIGIMAAVYALSAVAQTAKEVKGATPLVSIPNEPPAKLVVDPPVPTNWLWGASLFSIGPKTYAFCRYSGTPPWRYPHALDTYITTWMDSRGLSSTRAVKRWSSSDYPPVRTRSGSNWRTRHTNRSQDAAKWWSLPFLLASSCTREGS